MKIIIIRVAGITIAAIALSSTPTAHADPNDDTYFDILTSTGVPYISKQDSIAAGHGVCEALSEGLSEEAINGYLVGHSRLTEGQAGTLIGAAETQYCPDRYSPSGR